MKQLELRGKTILVTGAAGFIGANLVLRLLTEAGGAAVIGIDNMNDYYDVSIKEYRLRQIADRCREVGASYVELRCAEDAARRAEERSGAETGTARQTEENSGPGIGTARQAQERFDAPGGGCCGQKAGTSFTLIRGSIADRETVAALFRRYRPQIVVNLAAQAGVRWSISHPDDYIESNVIGFYNLLEACRHSYDGGAPGVEHLVYASSSSVYGANEKVPYSTDDKVDNPVSLYAATKRSDELMAHAYSKLYDIPSTGLRFFTVYGPAGRPDMAYYGFTNQLRAGGTIRIFNYGNCRRDFTYIDDVVEGIVRVMQGAPERRTGEDGLPVPPYAIYNIGNSHPENLMDFVRILQEELIRAGVLPADYDGAAHMELVPMQAGDVPVTYADTAPLERDYGFRPATDLRDGLRAFARWYAEFYGEE